MVGRGSAGGLGEGNPTGLGFYIWDCAGSAIKATLRIEEGEEGDLKPQYCCAQGSPVVLLTEENTHAGQ